MDTARTRVRGIALAVACVLAGCGSPAPATTPGPSGSAGAPPSAAASGGQDVAAGLPRPAGDAVVATLLGVPDRPLTPDMASLRDEILRQLGEAPTRPVTLPDVKLTSWQPGSGGTTGAPPAAGDDSVLVGFLLVDMAVMGKVLPSKQAADALGGMILKAAGTRGPEGPDQIPETQAPRDSTPFDAILPSGSRASGTMETRFSTKAERSLVSVKLDRELILNYAAGPGSTAESGTTTITIRNEASVDFCPDVGGVVPVKLTTSFTMAQPSATITAAIDGDFRALVDDNANLVFTNGNARVTRLTASGVGPQDADVQLTNISLDPSGRSTVGDMQGREASAEAAANAAGAALVDIDNAIPTIVGMAQNAWRQSSCVAVQLPDFNAYAGGMSDGDGQKDVDPASKTEFTAKVHQRFEHRDVDFPIKVTLRTEKSIDPTRLPSTPSKLTYEAPDKPNAHHAVTLEVASKRGKSKLVMRFDTLDLKLQAKVDGTVLLNATGNRYDTKIHLKPTDLTQGDDGAFHARATVSWTTTYTGPPACKPVTYTGTFDTDITVTVDPEDPTSVFFKATFIPGVLKSEVLVCNGRSFPFTGGTSLGSWATLGVPHKLVLGQRLKIPSSAAFGTASNTVTITKKPPK